MDKHWEIEKVLKGKSMTGEGSLSFSCLKVEFSLKPGETKQGSFSITGQAGLPLLGKVVADDIRMRCLNDNFKENPAEIFYSFDSTGLEEGETVRGEFQVLSNQGEYLLPFMVTVQPRVLETSLGQMKNLFHFANLAKTNWQEAVRAFYSPEFIKILTGNDRQYINVYRALRMPPEKEQRVEEFLVWIRKKQRVEYLPDKESIVLMPSEDVVREVVTLTRNGWGYTKLFVETEGEFLQTEKSVLTDDDFLGNQCACGLLVFHDALHAGYNYGSVRFYNEYCSLKIPVCVEHTHILLGRSKRSRKQKMVEFYHYYLEYSMGRISRQEWLAQTECIVESMDARGHKNPIQELFKAHLLLTRERYNEAKWLLEQADKLITPGKTMPVIWCYYLYLTTLVSEDAVYIRSVTDEIRRRYQSEQTSWEMAWLLLYLDEECSKSLSRKWIFLEQQFEKGCHSPVWYLEAAVLVRKNPAFLMKLTPFVLQTLNFMARYDFLTEECIGQIHYLSGRLKQYSKRMYEILQVCYEKKQDEESLRSICRLLIKGGKTGPEYVRWYREGIKRELWLTRLYEYYILSVDMEQEEEIPVAALRYFSYRSELPYERTAYLYAYIVREKERYPDLYRTYFPLLEDFLTKQLEKKRMNRDIACLLRELIQEKLFAGELLGRYADCLFMHEIRVLSPGISKVMVVHGRLQGEKICPLNGSRAYVPVYDEDFSLIFEDASGNRRICSIEYENRPLFYSEEILAELLPPQAGMLTENAGVLLYQCMRGRTYITLNKNNICYAKRLWNHSEIGSCYRDELGTRLLQYYQKQDAPEELDGFLTGLSPAGMNGKERTEAVRCMILRGMYETAFSWLDRYGAERIPPKLIVRLCSRLLREEIPVSRSLLPLVHLAFKKGKYDENILRYLGDNFIGTIREMGEIWNACRQFDTGVYELTERLLLQMLFTGEYISEEADILKTYLEEGADEELLGAYLTHLAYEYFLCDQELQPFVWKELLRRSKNGEKQDEICELALLRYFSEKPYLDEEEQALLQQFLEELVLGRGIIFGFFGKFIPYVPMLSCYMNQTVLEYRTRSKNPMTLHYMLKTQNSSGGEYRTEELKSCYAGVYTKGFRLFFGESLHYYITEKKGQKETLVESGTLHYAAAGTQEERDRFSILNQLMAAICGQDGENAERLLEEYCRTDFVSEKLFSLQ